jgi:hypothetical protein
MKNNQIKAEILPQKLNMPNTVIYIYLELTVALSYIKL